MQKNTPQLLSKLSLLIPENEFYAVMYDRGSNPTPYYHYHDYYEIIFYLGDREILYAKDDREFQIGRGDIIFCGMFENHVVNCADNTGYRRFCIGIEPRVIGNFSKKDANLYLLFSEQNPHYPIAHLSADQLEKYLRMMRDYQQLDGSPGTQIIASSIIHYMLGSLFCDLQLDRCIDRENVQHIRLVGSIISYIEHHLAEELRLTDIARRYNYSVTHIGRIFKKTTGSSLVNYIIEKRIQCATHLMNEGLEITQTAEKVGYGNYSNFYKTFVRIMGMNPDEYRRRLSGGTV